MPPKHIPDYLPSFPPEHTYKHTTSFPQIKDETEETYRKEKEMTLATEKALVNLEQSKEEGLISLILNTIINDIS